jgi:glucosamine 6-phosphate synthetase-like amidotransferase/phosphosugar isomerase protein
MCAIVGSSNASKFEVMYEANLPRGNFASGLIGLNSGGDQMVLKKKGTINFDLIQLDDINDYFIGHVQAPTSAKRSWSYDTSHPFESLSWSVVHNGVLTNHEQIRSKHVDWDVNPVDTAVIANLLQHFTEECRGECPAHEIIKRVLGLLEGTFALCMVDTDCNDVYIARQGSILHYNDHGDFSTLGGEGFKILPEGTILMLKDYKKWEVVNHFETKSPFLFL